MDVRPVPLRRAEELKQAPSAKLPDGYTDVPPGKLVNVVTCLEMFERPPLRPEREDVPYTLERVEQPDPSWYRALFARVGEPWLWFSRLAMDPQRLREELCDSRVEVYAVRSRGDDVGLLELDFRVANECELRYFGLVPSFVGKGAGRWLMNRAIERAWAHPIRRFWVHTCTLDHPGAVAFYVRSGFVPFKRQIEVADDPRLVGLLPQTAAPEVPIL